MVRALVVWGAGPGALAATPVIGDAPTAVATAAERLGVPEAELTPVDLATLQQVPASRSSGGAVTACLGAPGAAPAPASAFEAVLARAEGALLYGEFDGARARLAEARDAALCGPPVPPGRLARVELVAGLVAEEQGALDEATERYAAALGYDPDLAWHEAYPEDRRARFDAARAALGAPPPAKLAVYPSTGANVDGRPVSTATTGEHVVRTGSVAVRVTLDALPDTLIVPSGFGDDALAGMSDAALRAELSALFALHLGEARDAVVVHGADVWTGITGRTDWTYHPPPAGPPPAVPQGSLAGHRRSLLGPIVLTAVGAGLGATGGALSGLALHDLRALVEGARGGSYSAAEITALEDDYNGLVDRTLAGYGVAGGGAAVAAVGLTWGLAVAL